MIKNLEVTLLVNNLVYKKGLISEHGLSFHLNYDGKQLLFDTGQGLVLMHNAANLGIDFKAIDKLVLSHGHYDHTGGLMQIAELGNPVAVYGHTDLFQERFGKIKGINKKIGLPFLQDELEYAGMRFHLHAESTEIDPGVVMSGQVDRVMPDAKVGILLDENGNETKDPVNDDLFLLISTEWGDIVVLGCSHSGIRNSIDHALSLSKHGRIKLVMGGMHLIGAKAEDVEDHIKYLWDRGVRYLMPIHCSGRDAICAGSRVFGEGFIEGAVGVKVKVNDEGISW